MKYRVDHIFPTEILTLDLSGEFTQLEIRSMTDHIDHMIESGQDMQLDDATPRYQCLPVLFRENAPELFSNRLRKLFFRACARYLRDVKNFTVNQDAIVFTHTSAWFYCGWPEINSNSQNPWHQHAPAFLSGVFYLRNAGDPETSGTIFHDPRGPWSHASRMRYVPGTPGHLVVFPGWLYHKPMLDDNNREKRYTIACNAYAAVR